MKAIYATYAVTDHITAVKNYTAGQIVNFEVKVKGIAPKVADWPRLPWQSVVRYSITDNLRYQWLSILPEGIINEDRNLVIGDRVVLEEDKENSLIYVEKIEERE